MANPRSVNPFDQEGPTSYDQWNYVVGQAHGQLIIELTQRVDMLQETINEHARQHEASNRSVLDLPAIKQTEKPS